MNLRTVPSPEGAQGFSKICCSFTRQPLTLSYTFTLLLADVAPSKLRTWLEADPLCGTRYMLSRARGRSFSARQNLNACAFEISLLKTSSLPPLWWSHIRRVVSGLTMTGSRLDLRNRLKGRQRDVDSHVPRDATYTTTAETDRLYSGRLHPAAESYAAAKRALAQLTQWYRTQHGDAFTCVLPGNFYGAYGDFDPASAPLVNALVARAVRVGSCVGHCSRIWTTHRAHSHDCR